MEQRKRHRTAITLKVCMVVLLILALPSWSLSQPPEEKQDRGILSQLYYMLTANPWGPPTADVVVGVPDHYDGDRPGGGKFYIMSDGSLRDEAGVSGCPAPEPPPPKTLWEDMTDHPTDPRVVKMRKRIAARRAKKALKAAQASARHKKKLAREQAARAANNNQSRGCFPHDIRVVMADGTARSIADVKAGDVVLTYDIGYDQIIGKSVVATYTVKSNHLYTINDGLQATGGERVLTESGWRALSALTQQDHVHSNGQMVDVDAITYKRMKLTTYNMQVDDTHNFYVVTESGDTYLVHNSCGGGK